MHAIAIIPAVSMRNPKLDAYCSLYGSIPPGFTEQVTRGYTIVYIDAHGRQVIGNGSTPYNTEEEAVAAANATNDRRRRQLEEHAAAYPEQLQACRAAAEKIPHFGTTTPTAAAEPKKPYKLALVENRKRCAMLETTPRYDVMLNGKNAGELYFNMTGYVGTLPTPDGRQLSIGERPIAAYRKEVRRLNQEARAALVTA